MDEGVCGSVGVEGQEISGEHLLKIFCKEAVFRLRPNRAPTAPFSLLPAIACCHILNYFSPYLEVFAILGLSAFSNLTSQKMSHYVVFH